MKMILAILAIAAFLLGTVGNSLAQGNLTTLVNFNGSNGANPEGKLTLSSDGNTLYGTTVNGGPNGEGTVFSMPVGGGAITILASFNANSGNFPAGGLTLSSDGKTLYGTTYNGSGTVFSIPVAGGVVTTLASFNGSNGSSPEGNLTLSSDGNTLYGTTYNGGSNGYGTVFSVPVGGGVISTLATFNGSNGANPIGSLTLSSNGNTLYGTTYYGGAGYIKSQGGGGEGTVFSIPVGGGTITTLASFLGDSSTDPTDGTNPAGGLMLSKDGKTLYGTTEYGTPGSDNGGPGYGYGTVFSLPTSGGATTTLASFNGANGENPEDSLILSKDGNTLYGITYSGGTNIEGDTDSNGTVFSIPVSGGAITTVVSFNGTNGANPKIGLTLSSDGKMLYGTTYYGGTNNTNNNDGTVFSLVPGATWSCVDVTVGTDSKARLLWSRFDGAASVWTVDNHGVSSNLTNLGTYAGWTATAIAAGADDYTRILWNKTDGTAGLWILNSINTFKTGFNFGPYAGWTAVDVAVGSDNKARLLWTKSDGTAAVWTVDNSGNLTNLANLGPYPGWTASRIAAGSDGYTRLLWNKTDGTAGLWILNTNNAYKAGFNFGPYNGTTAVDITVGADNKARLLWTDVEGEIAVWTVDNSGNYTSATSFGPYTDWTATKIAVGGDGLSRLLWNKTDGTAGLWLLNSNNTLNNGFNFGPY